MRAQFVPVTTAPIDQILIDGEFDEFENFNASGLNGQNQADFQDSWDDEALLELL